MGNEGNEEKESLAGQFAFSESYLLGNAPNYASLHKVSKKG